MMKLYSYYRSSASYRIRIILNFKGLPWEYLSVMLNRGEQHAAGYKALNPMGFVPLLAADDGLLTQSPAIAEYLEERFPAPALLPDDALVRAQVREIQSLIGCDIHPLQNLRVLNYLREKLGQDDAGVQAWCRYWIGEGFSAVESLVKKRSTDGRFCIGDALSLADVWLVPQLYNAERFELDLNPFPTIVSIGRHCTSLAVFAAAHPAQQPDAPDS